MDEKQTLQLEQMGFEGDAIAYADDKVYFAAGGIPGEKVRVEILDERGPYVHTSVQEVLEGSPDRVEAPCPYFGACGGCQWQHISYARQLRLKRAVVEDQLRGSGHFVDPPVQPTLGMDDPWYYRNQARFTVNDNGELGFTTAHEHDFLRVDHCMIMHPAINDALESLQGRAHVRHQLAVRYGFETGDLLVEPQVPDDDDLPFETGQRHYDDQLLGRRFRVFSSSFFQTNTVQAERLAELVIKKLDLTGEEVVVDAYCGVGTFAALVAEEAGHVIGIEVATSALADARYNTRDLDNVEFIQGETKWVLPELAFERVDAVVLDPSRKGCGKKVIDGLLQVAPPRVIYVSCDPDTLSRDLNWLCEESRYELVEAQPVDMFPQTYHIEVVAALHRV